MSELPRSAPETAMEARVRRKVHDRLTIEAELSVDRGEVVVLFGRSAREKRRSSG